MTTYIIILGLIGLLALFVLFFIVTYKVINPNHAHVVVFMGRGRKIYSPKIQEGVKTKTAYFYIPLLMKRFILPLTNVKMDIRDIHLNDIQVAPFICDVITWIHIKNPIMAAERLNLGAGDQFASLREDIINIVQAVARAVAMKQEILDIMRDRKTFADSVSREVGSVLEAWGIDLINLEVNDIRDDKEKDSRVITDYESMRKIQVNSKARKEIAERDREAVEVEQQNLEKAEIAKAQAEENYIKRRIEKDKNVGIMEQGKEKEIATKQEEANRQEVSALRALEVGKAAVQKEATIEVATGEAEAVRVKGEKEADVIRLKGEADGKAIQARGTAEAVAKDRMAEAMQKFNDAATGIEQIRAWIEVEKAKYDALALALSNADLKLVQSGKGGKLFGFPLNAEVGADLGQMFEGMGPDKIKDILDKFSRKNNDSPEEMKPVDEK